MTLLSAPIGEELKIMEICSESDEKRRLTSLGIHIDDVVLKINAAKWGPLLVKNVSTRANKIAICRFLADKIIVGK